MTTIDLSVRLALPVRTVFGVVASFRRISTSNDDTHYALTIVPRIALLGYTKGSEIYLNQSVTEVVEQVLRKHGLEGPDFEFRLERTYPPREIITQWRETDLEFIRRILSEMGIYWRTEMDDVRGLDIYIFADSQLNYRFDVRLPYREPSGLFDGAAESVWVITVLPARSSQLLIPASFLTTSTCSLSMYGSENV